MSFRDMGQQYLLINSLNSPPFVFHKKVTGWHACKIITLSARVAGKWQVTHWDDYGPAGHYNETCFCRAIGELLNGGYWPITRKAFEAIMMESGPIIRTNLEPVLNAFQREEEKEEC